jgi:hypothetical protein
MVYFINIIHVQNIMLQYSTTYLTIIHSHVY